MHTRTVHLEDITRTARQGIALAFAISLLGLVTLLIAGLSAAIAIPVALAILALGVASGGFGLVGRMALPQVPARRTAKRSSRGLEPLRVPQPR